MAWPLVHCYWSGEIKLRARDLLLHSNRHNKNGHNASIFINENRWNYLILFLSSYFTGSKLYMRQPNDGFTKFQKTAIAYSLEIPSKPNTIKGCNSEHIIAQLSFQDFVMHFLNGYHLAIALHFWQTKKDYNYRFVLKNSTQKLKIQNPT